MHVDTSPRSFVDDPAFGAELDQLDRGLVDEGLTDREPPEAAAPDNDQPAPTRQLRGLQPASMFVHQACEDTASAAPSLSHDPTFFERLGTTLDDLDHLASRTRGASVDELGIPESVPPHEGARSFDDQDQTVTAPSTFRMMVTRTAYVAMFIACMGLGGLAAAFVFHDRLAQLQLF